MPKSQRGGPAKVTTKKNVAKKAAQIRTRAGRVETERRIADVMKMMRDLTYRSSSIPDLACQWKVTENRVKEITAEAHKRLVAEVQNPVEVGRDLGAVLSQVIRDCVADKDRRNLMQAARILATLVGANAPTRVILREEPVQALSDEQLEALAREALAVLKVGKK